MTASGTSWILLLCSMAFNYWFYEDRAVLKTEIEELKESHADLKVQRAKVEDLRKEKLELETNAKACQEETAQAHSELAKKEGQLSENEKRLEAKDKELLNVRDDMATLKKDKCGSFVLTPGGAAELLEEWTAKNDWWALIPLTIFGNLIFYAMMSGIWKLFVFSRSASSRPVAIAGSEDAMVPVYEQWPVFWTRRVAGWCVAFFALTVLPVLVTNYVGGVAVDKATASQDALCNGWSICDAAFFYVITPNAKLVAQAETYVWLFRGWQRVVTAQTVAFAADQVLVLAICIVAWPFTRRFDYVPALPSSSATISLEDVDGSDGEDDEDDKENKMAAEVNVDSNDGTSDQPETTSRKGNRNQRSKKGGQQ